MDWSAPGPDRHGAERRVRVTALARAALLADLRARLAAGQGFSVATLNLDHAVKLRSDPAFRAAYLAHSHVTADGNPVVWLSRLAGERVELVPGADLVEPLAGIAAGLGVPVALFGSTEGSLAAAAEALVARHPGLRIAARIAPPMGFDPTGPEAARLSEALGEALGGRGLCLLALGAPRQERFAAFAQERWPGIGFLSIGAGLDFLSGRQRRAPRLMRALALEWLWRLGQDPGRLAGRYLACVAILPGLTMAALRARGGGDGAGDGGGGGGR